MDKKLRTAMITGALAGALPILINLINADASTIFKKFDFVVFLGYCLKVILLMGLGAFLVRVNEETDLKKAFQLGIMAPALVVGLVNGNNLNDMQKQLDNAQQQLQQYQSAETTNHTGFQFEPQHNPISMSIVSVAHAQNVPPKGLHRDINVLSKVWYGISGKLENGWFVIVGSHRDKADAEKQAIELRRQGWDARVGSKYIWGEYYAVLIGSYLKMEEAQAIRSYAVDQGLPKDTYIWKRNP